MDPIPNCQFFRSHENSALSQFRCSALDNRSMSRERFDPLYQGVPSQTSNCLPTNFLLLPQLLRSHRSHRWYWQKPRQEKYFQMFSITILSQTWVELYPSRNLINLCLCFFCVVVFSTLCFVLWVLTLFLSIARGGGVPTGESADQPVLNFGSILE